MVAVKLELRCPKSVAGVVIDPQPDWTFDTLLSELNSIEKKLDESSVFPLPFTKAKSREFTFAKFLEKRAFIMRVDEMEDFEEEDSGEEDHNGDLLEGRRFACDEFYASDGEDSEDELPRGAECQLMEEVGLVESALSELTHEHQICVMEEIRNHICAVEMDLINEKKEFTSALAQVKKYIDTRQEMDRKLDIQYQRRIAEALDNHLTAVQRDHEHKSQIEERRIKDDAAVEEAKRREKALQDEKLRQEKIRAEAEARVEAERKRAEEAKAAALEAEKKAAKEAAEKVASENTASAATLGVINKPSHKSGSNGEREVQQAGNLVKCAESALKLEERKQQIYKEIVDKNVALGLGPGSNFVNPGSKIKKLVRQINGIKENERNKVEQLSKIFLDPSCPQSISITSFAETIVYQSARPESAVFGYANVIVLLSSQVPVVMDLVLAKLNTVCIYTIPKYINYAKSAFDTRETYCKAIGYDGEDESEESYISRMESYMKLYGALVQTEIPGVRNTHGLEEGWAWLARFLNALPANIYTAAALQAFLEVAGFALYRRYKSQFKKLLNIIYRDFVNALKEQGGDPKLTKVTTSLQTYIESSMFLEEPKRRSVQGSLLSNAFVPELEYQFSDPSYNRPSNRFYYGY